ncbi:Chondramide synthase cmdD [compost metagenome]
MAWSIVWQWFSGQKDLTIGITMSGRNLDIPGIMEIVGLLINTVPFRIKDMPGASVSERLKQLSIDLITIEEVIDTPLDVIRKSGNIDYFSPLFESVIVIQNYPMDVVTPYFGGGHPLSIDLESSFYMTDLNLVLSVTLHKGIKLSYSYHPKQLTKQLIVQLNKQLINVLQEIANSSINEPWFPQLESATSEDLTQDITNLVLQMEADFD